MNRQLAQRPTASGEGVGMARRRHQDISEGSALTDSNRDVASFPRSWQNRPQEPAR